MHTDSCVNVEHLKNCFRKTEGKRETHFGLFKYSFNFGPKRRQQQ